MPHITNLTPIQTIKRIKNLTKKYFVLGETTSNVEIEENHFYSEANIALSEDFVSSLELSNLERAFCVIKIHTFIDPKNNDNSYTFEYAVLISNLSKLFVDGECIEEVSSASFGGSVADETILKNTLNKLLPVYSDSLNKVFSSYSSLVTA